MCPASAKSGVTSENGSKYQVAKKEQINHLLIYTWRYITHRVEVLVEGVEADRAAAVGVVPPVADEDLLVEDGALGAQEAVLAAVVVAVVVHLQKKQCYGYDPRLVARRKEVVSSGQKKEILLMLVQQNLNALIILVILTHLHLAKSHPNALYSLHLLSRSSRP